MTGFFAGMWSVVRGQWPLYRSLLTCHRSLVTSLILMLALTACGTPKPPYQGIRIGKPYEVNGHIYVPKYRPDYDETGVASWYGPGFHGGHTASGERYNQDDLTAAHKTLPLPSLVRVTNLDNGASAIIRVNDRGPFASGRIIDLSRGSALKLGVYQSGLAKVRVQFLDKETRDYVSSLPNGVKSLRTLDLAKETGQIQNVRKQEIIEISDIGGTQETDNADNRAEALPFIAPPVRGQAATQTGWEHNHSPEDTMFAAALAASKPLPAQTSVVRARLQPQPPENTHGIFIQVATFSVKANADRMLQMIAGIAPAHLVETDSGGKRFYRVLAGAFKSAEDAKNMLSKLAAMGISGTRIIRN